MERVLVAGAALYVLYISVAMGGAHDPVVAFVLAPIAALFIGFLEACEFARVNANDKP